MIKCIMFKPFINSHKRIGMNVEILGPPELLTTLCHESSLHIKTTGSAVSLTFISAHTLFLYVSSLPLVLKEKLLLSYIWLSELAWMSLE